MIEQQIREIPPHIQRSLRALADNESFRIVMEWQLNENREQEGLPEEPQYRKGYNDALIALLILSGWSPSWQVVSQRREPHETDQDTQ